MDSFWDRTKRILSALDKPDIWLIKNAGLGKTAIVNGQRRQTSPSVDIAYRCAKVLQTTVEELVDGEAGVQYLREYIREAGWTFAPPERLAGIMEAAKELSDEQLGYVMGLIKAMLESPGVKSETEPKSRPPIAG